MPKDRTQLDAWIEVFAAGEQTDSAGNVRTWTEADLDSMVENFDPAHPPPAVRGHPETDAPAYGWAAAVKREGRKLLARFRDWHEPFAEAVLAGRWRNRSIALDPAEGGGWKIRHVGWLGAALPAVPDLEPVYHNDTPPAHVFETRGDPVASGILARALRRMREFLIEHFGAEAAERVIPEYEAEALADHAREAWDDAREQPMGPAYAAPATTGGTTMPETHPQAAAGQYTQAQLDAAREGAAKVEREARERAAAEFAEREKALNEQLRAARHERRVAEAGRAVEAAIDRGVPPAALAGAAEFLAALPDGESAGFTFSAPGEDGKDTERKATPAAWFAAHLEALAGIVDMGGQRGGAASEPQGAGDKRGEFSAPRGYAIDAEAAAIHARAIQYQREHPETEYLAAVAAVSQ